MPLQELVWSRSELVVDLGLKICRSHQGQGILWTSLDGHLAFTRICLGTKKCSVLQKFRQKKLYSRTLQDAEPLVRVWHSTPRGLHDQMHTRAPPWAHPQRAEGLRILCTLTLGTSNSWWSNGMGRACMVCWKKNQNKTTFIGWEIPVKSAPPPLSQLKRSLKQLIWKSDCFHPEPLLATPRH